MMIGVIKWEYQYLFPKTFNATLFRSLEDPEKSFSILLRVTFNVYNISLLVTLFYYLTNPPSLPQMGHLNCNQLHWLILVSRHRGYEKLFIVVVGVIGSNCHPPLIRIVGGGCTNPIGIIIQSN